MSVNHKDGAAGSSSNNSTKKFMQENTEESKSSPAKAEVQAGSSKPSRKSTLRLEPPQNLHQSKRNILPRSNQSFIFKEDATIERINQFRKYVRGGVTLTGLPKFDDLSIYDVSEDRAQKLYAIEVERLVNVAASDESLFFDSAGSLGITSSKGFQDASNLADQLACNIAIMEHDNSLITLEHCRWSSVLHYAISQLKESRTVLVTRYEEDENRVQAQRPKPLDSAEANAKAYFALVDHIIGTVAKLVVRSATSDYWNYNALAVLAQWATKLKVLSSDPVHFASLSLVSFEDVIGRLGEQDSKENLFVVKLRTSDSDSLALGPKGNEIDVEDFESDISGTYYREQQALRMHLIYLVKHAARALYASEKTGNPANSYEVCTVVYETGLERCLTVLNSDRGGDVTASSDPTHLKCSYTALGLLMKTTRALCARERNPQNMEHAASIKFKWSEGEQTNSAEKGLLITSMDELISIMVPFSLTDAHSAIEIGNMIQFASTYTEEEDPIFQFEGRHFHAKFTISTAEWLSRKQRQTSFHHLAHSDPEVVSVSGSPLDRMIRAGTRLESLDRTSKAALAVYQSHVQIESYRKVEKQLKHWVIAESSVTVPCKQYIVIVLAFCTLILCGGLAVPFVVKQRITGVDPFQVTTFAWLLVGAILVVAKGRYVSDWPWHDFLSGIVVCGSVSDVAKVTGVHPQMILMHLLHNERNNTLTTKGPYNGMFQRTVAGGVDPLGGPPPGSGGAPMPTVGITSRDGFSIDEPVDLSTMLTSGFVVLKVLSEKGEHLICLDVRKGAPWDWASRNQYKFFLACMDLGKDKRDIDESDGKFKVLKLTWNEVRWNRVLGLFIGDSSFG